MRYYKSKKIKEHQIPMNTKTITVNKEVRIPNTDIILEKGDKIKVFYEPIRKKDEKVNKKSIKENSIWKDKILSAKGNILFDDELYKMDSYGGFKNPPKPADVLDIFSDYMTIENWFSSNNLYYLVEEMGIDLSYDYPITIMSELSDFDIVSNVKSDNTYNWSWLGPWDIVFAMAKLKLKNEYVTFFAIHEGGDVRSNYGPTYVYTSNYEFGFLEELMTSINASITISFKDGGSIIADSQQHSDIWYFEVEIDEYSEMAEQFLEYCENIGQGFELDEFLTDFLG